MTQQSFVMNFLHRFKRGVGKSTFSSLIPLHNLGIFWSKKEFFLHIHIRKVKWRRILNTRFSGVEAFTLKRRWETSKYYHYHYHVYVIQSCSLWKTPVVLQFVVLLFHHLLLSGWGTWMDGGQDGWRDGWMERTTTTGQTEDIIYKDKTRRRFRV